MKSSTDITKAISLAAIKEKYLHALTNLGLFSANEISYEVLAENLKRYFPKYYKHLYKTTNKQELFIGCFVQTNVMNVIYPEISSENVIFSFVFLPTSLEADTYEYVMNGLIFKKESEIKKLKWI